MTSEEARIKSEQKLCKALSFMFSSVNDIAKNEYDMEYNS